MSEGFERYPNHGGSRYPTILAPIVGTFVLVLGVLALIQNLTEGEVFIAVASAYFSLMLFLGGLGIGLMRTNARGHFRFLNAVVMTRAERAPVDSWVHVAPTRPLPWPIILCNVMFTLGMGFAFVAALLQLLGVMPKLNPDTTPLTFGFALVMTLVLCGFSGFTAYLNLGRKWRNGRFGARPSGIALGEHAVSLRMPGIDAEIAWEHIEAVSAEVMSGHRRSRDITMIRLDLLPDTGTVGRVQRLEAYSYTVPTDALYSALRWYQAHPELRGELGHTEGTQRLDAWRRDALA